MRVVCNRGSIATQLPRAESSRQEAEAEGSHLRAKAGGSGHLQEQPLGSSSPALLALGEHCACLCLAMHVVVTLAATILRHKAAQEYERSTLGLLACTG